MFDFLKIIDIKLVAVISQLENDIKYKSGNILVTFQTFCELLLKNVEYQESGNISYKKPLGQFLEDDFFTDILLNDLYVNTDELNTINRLANKVKHEGNYKYDDFEIKGFLRFIFDFSKSVLDYYYEDEKVKVEFDPEYYNDLIASFHDDKEIMRQHYQNQVNKIGEEYSNRLKRILEEKNLLENKIKETEKEKDIYKEQIKKLDNLETELQIKDNKIAELRKSKAAIEEELNEKSLEEKRKLDKEIRRLKTESFTLKEKIEELRANDTVDPKIKLDRFIKTLEEKEQEIEEYKSLIANQEIVKDEKLFKLYKKNALNLGFSSSYSKDDSYFIVTGLSKEVYSTSKYKSFYAVLNNLLQRGYLIKQSKYLAGENLDVSELRIVFRLEMMILSLLRNNRLKDKIWKINYIDGDIKLLKIACNDIFYWLELITDISTISYIKPELDLINNSYTEDYINIKYDNKNNYDDNIYVIMDILMVDDEDNDDFFSLWIDDYINYDVPDNKDELEKILYELFGFENFNDGQFEILKHTLNGNNTIGILPTGGGKSLIYQFASLLEPKITIVVDPINSLIKDQLDGLANRFGITRCLNLTSSNENRALDENKLRRGHAMFVFLSPERFQVEGFRKILMGLASNKSIERIVLDEVHCLSEWGHDFRIPYLMLADTLKSYCGNSVKYLGLTATAAASVINDLIVELRMDAKDVIYLPRLRRNNLKFHFKTFDYEDDLPIELKKVVEKTNPKLNGDKTNSMIIFSRTIAGKSNTSIENTYLQLQGMFKEYLEVYHGTLNNDNKVIAQDNFVNNKKSILIATKAFGMGIDKPNIRCTVHYGIPNSFEAFYQEAGRAGRDRKPADCYLFTYKTSNFENKLIDEFFQDDKDAFEMQEIQKQLKGTDINTNMWFFTNQLDTPRNEASRAYNLYKNLVSYSNKDNIILQDERSFPKEKILYILHKLGIVTNWEKNYSINTLTVHLSSYYNDIEYIKNEADRYISQYKDFKETHDSIERISSINELEKLIFVIREWYFNNFILGRKNQLYNMVSKIRDFSNRNCSEEIQEQIDSYFDLTNIINETEEGYSLKFENESFGEIIDYITELDEDIIDKRQIEMERMLESITTSNISLYTSLLHLRKGEFDSRNGKQRFEYVYNESEDADKVEILIGLAENLYPVLAEDRKEVLLDTLYQLDYVRMRSVFLEHVKEDNLNKKYWLSYINERLSNIRIGV